MEWAKLLTYIQEGENQNLKFLSHLDTVDKLGPLIVMGTFPLIVLINQLFLKNHLQAWVENLFEASL